MYRGERPWIDLTRPMNAGMEIYSTGAYADPPFRAEPWCDLSEAGFAVWHLQMGTQTGTHIDAPSHFVQGAATLSGPGSRTSVVNASAWLRFTLVTRARTTSPGRPRRTNTTKPFSLATPFPP